MGSCTSKPSQRSEQFGMLKERGDFLGADLRAMFNNPVYSDIIITCKDGRIVYGSKLLLAARSDVFSRIFLNPSVTNNEGEIINNSISFLEFTSSTLLIILEYLYLGYITHDTLSLGNVVEAYLCSEYFMIPKLEEIIISFLDNALKCSADSNLAAKLLSQAIEFMLPSSDDIFFRTLYNCLVITPLDTIEYEILNEEVLKFILSPIHKDENENIEFITTEYGVFRYLLLWSVHKISPDLLPSFELLLPSTDIAEHLDSQQLIQLRKLQEKFNKNPNNSEVKQSILLILSPLWDYIDFKLIHPSILANIVSPLNIIPSDILGNAFKWHAQLPAGNRPKRNRGIVTAKPGNLKLHWDRKAHGKKMVLLDHGAVIKSQSRKFEFARTSLPIRGYEIYEWDFIIEEPCKHMWIGVCSVKNRKVNYSTWLGGEEYGWVLGSNGYLAHCKVRFTKGTKITVHLNMENRTLSYSVNGINFGEAFRDLPNEVYPAVSIKSPGKIRIQPHTFSINSYQDNNNELSLSTSPLNSLDNYSSISPIKSESQNMSSEL
ncbi:2381_t:CDS:2 [Diversispora eburnea]|uniref:2381_t:CDS:1 n=1 Tax=Diversispora eburnea TaxID=1213867 RepID=A0A9N9A951_9GLOM|nr:2381_t:CDS:2 [Diversispora eburnea]